MVIRINALWVGVIAPMGKECETPITRERIPSLACAFLLPFRLLPVVLNDAASAGFAVARDFWQPS